MVSVDAELFFTSNQIVCLEYQNNLLYTEVVQSLLDREWCWTRPLCMAIAHTEESGNFGNDNSVETIIDLRFSSDLILPNCLFRPALDLELIPLLARLEKKDELESIEQLPNKYLNRFIRLVWQANREKFAVDR
jgi:hypothetical protein